MSRFRVNLRNKVQGTLDDVLVTRNGRLVSNQRTAYVMGPKRVNRLLRDGDEFEDCNYWKRFATPQCSPEDAIIEVLEDDGAIWSDDPAENTFPYIWTKTIVGGTTYTAENNIIDVMATLGGPAVFTQIMNNGNNDLNVRINGSANAILTVKHGGGQVFNSRDLAITKLEFDNSAEDAADANVQVVCAGKEVPAS